MSEKLKFGSLEHYGVSVVRIILLGMAASVGSAAVLAAAVGGALGGNAPALSFVLGCTVFYLVVSLPKRALDAESFAQSKETPTIAVMTAAGLDSTGSRSRTILLLKTANRELNRTLLEIKRLILLGHSVESSVEQVAGSLASYSLLNVLREAAAMQPESIEEHGEETQAISGALRLSDESKFPLLLAACFFSPILILLFAVLSHRSDPLNLLGLVFLQAVVLDLAYYFTSSDKRSLFEPRS